MMPAALMLLCYNFTQINVHLDLYLLVYSILELPKSVQVRLEGCNIRQGTRDWKAYIRSHPQLTVDLDHVYDVSMERNVHLLKFHTNKF